MQQETHLSSEQLLEAQEDGMGIFVSCGPALGSKEALQGPKEEANLSRKLPQ